jgi:hypothetical protein
MFQRIRLNSYRVSRKFSMQLLLTSAFQKNTTVTSMLFVSTMSTHSPVNANLDTPAMA